MPRPMTKERAAAMPTAELIVTLVNPDVFNEAVLPDDADLKLPDEEAQRLIVEGAMALANEINRRIPIPKEAP